MPPPQNLKGYLDIQPFFENFILQAPKFLFHNGFKTPQMEIAPVKGPGGARGLSAGRIFFVLSSKGHFQRLPGIFVLY